MRILAAYQQYILILIDKGREKSFGIYKEKPVDVDAKKQKAGYTTQVPTFQQSKEIEAVCIEIADDIGLRIESSSQCHPSIN